MRGGLAHKASWMLAGQLGNFFCQAAYFVLLARLLGVREYGLFAGSFALVNTITPYSALGSAMLVLRYASVDRRVAASFWGNALLTITAFTTLAVVLAIICRPFIHAFGNLWMVCALIVANCFFSQVTILGSSVAFAVGQPRLSAAMAVASNGVRLLVLCILKVSIDHATALQWSVALLVATGCAALVVYGVLHRAIGPAKVELQLLRRRFVEGLGFSVAGTTEAVNNDLDKIMLVHYGMTVQNGFYTLAYRVVDFATSPIIALNSAVMQKHFVLNAAGETTVSHLLRKSLLVSVSIGIVAAVAMRVGAPLLPLIAGKSYTGAIAALKILCWLPIIRGIHQMCGSAVTGLGHQNWRTAAQGSAAVLNVGLNAILIPSHGWRGAAWSTLASDSVIAVLNVTIFIVAYRAIAHKKQILESEAA